MILRGFFYDLYLDITIKSKTGHVWFYSLFLFY